MHKLSGFTLIELLIVVGIIGILAAIAYPLYTDHIIKLRRSLAATALVDVAGRLEQYYAFNNSYSGATLEKLKPYEVAFYKFSLSTTPSSYLVRAEPTGAQAKDDTSCGILALDQNGEKTAAGPASIADCWN